MEALKESRKKPVKKVENSNKNEIIEVIEFFNSHCGKNVRNTDANIQLIKTRLDEGYTSEDCINVIKLKYKEWKDDKMMSKYLRLSTLFNKTKFNAYFADIPTKSIAIKKDKYEEIY